MSLTALLELEFKPDALDDAKKVMERVLGETREFDGCLGIEILVDKGKVVADGPRDEVLQMLAGGRARLAAD